MNPIISYTFTDFTLDKWILKGEKLAKEYKFSKSFIKQWKDKGLNCNLFMRLSHVLNQEGISKEDIITLEDIGITKEHFAEILIQQAKYILALKNEMYSQFESLKEEVLLDQEIIKLNEKWSNWLEDIYINSLLNIGSVLIKGDKESKQISDNTVIRAYYKTLRKDGFWRYTVSWSKRLRKNKEESKELEVSPVIIDLKINEELLASASPKKQTTFKYSADDQEYLTFYNHNMWDDWIEAGVKMASNDVLPSKFVKQWKKKGLNSNLFKEFTKNYSKRVEITAEEFGEILKEQVKHLIELRNEMRFQYDKAKKEIFLEFEMDFVTERFAKWDKSLDILIEMGRELFTKEKSGRVINPNAELRTKYIEKKRKKYIRYSVINSNKVTS